MICIIDYGVNNLMSVKNALDFLGYKSIITNSFKEIENSDYIILPGIGSFRLAIESLKKYNLDLIIRDQVITKSKPILGICLGMQLLADIGEEDGHTEGLKLINGSVKKISAKSLPLPHIGFNEVEWLKETTSLNKNQDYYFVHSYEFIPENLENILGITSYGKSIVAAIKKEKIIGLQFHPEKSQSMGLNLLKLLIDSRNFE